MQGGMRGEQGGQEDVRGMEAGRCKAHGGVGGRKMQEARCGRQEDVRGKVWGAGKYGDKEVWGHGGYGQGSSTPPCSQTPPSLTNPCSATSNPSSCLIKGTSPEPCGRQDID